MSATLVVLITVRLVAILGLIRLSGHRSWSTGAIRLSGHRSWSTGAIHSCIWSPDTSDDEDHEQYTQNEQQRATKEYHKFSPPLTSVDHLLTNIAFIKTRLFLL